MPTAAPRPVPPPVDPVQKYADDRLGVMTLDEKIASMLMVHVPGLDPAAIGGFAAAYGLGGVILMRDNIPDPASTLAGWAPLMAGEAGLPALIATDQEGGVVQRIPDGGPSAAELRYADPSASRAAFADRAAMLSADGVSVNFGIVADVTGDPASFMSSRVLGADAAAASPRVAAAVRGENGRVFSTLKHFPGHGETTGDSHSSVPQSDVDLGGWRARDAPSFQAGIDAGAELVMFGHLAYTPVDAQPASLSATWHSVLRDELGFTGVTVTDDMGMLEASGIPEYANPDENAIRAVAAGNDLLLYVTPGDVDAMIAAVVGAVESGRIDAAIIDDAVTRDLELRRELWLRQHPELSF